MKNNNIVRVRCDVPQWVRTRIRNIAKEEGMYPRHLMALMLEGACEVWEELGHLDLYFKDVTKGVDGKWIRGKPPIE